MRNTRVYKPQMNYTTEWLIDEQNKFLNKEKVFTMSQQYAHGLSEYGFNYHNILRIPYSKVKYDRVDWYINNLIKSKYVEMAFACVEPDINKQTGDIDPVSNHLHFAWKGKKMNRGMLANSMRAKRMYLRDTMPIYDSMSYFTKHIGKSLSYHNIYV